MFTPNEGTLDRVVRGILGVALLVIALTVLAGVSQWVAGAAGAILLLTGAIGICPLYAVFGINTCPTQTPARHER